MPTTTLADPITMAAPTETMAAPAVTMAAVAGGTTQMTMPATISMAPQASTFTQYAPQTTTTRELGAPVYVSGQASLAAPTVTMAAPAFTEVFAAPAYSTV